MAILCLTGVPVEFAGRLAHERYMWGAARKFQLTATMLVVLAKARTHLDAQRFENGCRRTPA
jgi:hypothetical protein